MKAKDQKTAEEVTVKAIDALTESEQKELLECEAILEKDQKSYIAVGEALGQIHDKRLYRSETSNSFDKYCENRWGFTGSHARRLMEAHEVANKLRSDSKPVKEEQLPCNEYQARLIHVCQENHWVRVWKKILKIAAERNKKVTASLITEHLASSLPAKTRQKAKLSSSKPAPVVGVVKALDLIEEALKTATKKSQDDWTKLLKDLKEILKPEAAT